MAEIPGIWVRVVLDGGAELTGYVPTVDSPNEFWTTFKTQLVQLDQAEEILGNGERVRREKLYINRDRVQMVQILEGKP